MSTALLRSKLPEPGVFVSGGAHVALLLAALFAFASTQKFSDAQEAIPVEMVTQADFNEIMKGEKTAKDLKPAPRKAEKVADIPVPKPQPATPQAVADTPVPPPPLRRAPEPVAEEVPPKPVVARPEPVKPEPAKTVTPPARPRSAPVKAAQALPPTLPAPVRPEPVKAAPPPRTVEAKLEPDLPEDLDNPMVVRPVPRVAKPEPPKPEPAKPVAAAPAPPVPVPPKKIRPAEKSAVAAPALAKADPIARQLDQQRPPEPVKQAALKPDVPTPVPAPAPKPAAVQPAPTPQRSFDPSSIKDIINRDKPAQTAATAPEVSQTASIGAPTQSAPKMSPTLMAALDGLMMDQYNQCWTDNGIGANGYVPLIRVQYAPDGSLIGQPSLTNPPADPALRGLADDALRAIRKCNPLKIPAQYAPYYEQWRQRLLRMNPEDRTG